MKHKIQITLNVEYDAPYDTDKTAAKPLASRLESNLWGALGKGLLEASTDHNIDSWDMAVKVIDKERETEVIKVERHTPLASIIAYFSSDGPAFSAQLHGLIGAEQDGLTLTMSDINSALREAFHKYLAHLRGS